jgi:DNA-binding HxlR family transcriptional regulator
MLGNNYLDQNCSVAGALSIVGERWTLLIVRDLLLGCRRFEQLQRQLGVAPNILNTRLRRLTDAGILQRVPYQQRPARYEYQLTSKGRDLWPVVCALRGWGDVYVMNGVPPLIVRHRGCGGLIGSRTECDRCGSLVDSPDLEFESTDRGSP